MGKANRTQWGRLSWEFFHVDDQRVIQIGKLETWKCWWNGTIILGNPQRKPLFLRPWRKMGFHHVWQRAYTSEHKLQINQLYMDIYNRYIMYGF